MQFSMKLDFNPKDKFNIFRGHAIAVPALDEPFKDAEKLSSVVTDIPFL